MDLSSAALTGASPGVILRDKTIAGLHARVTTAGKRFYLYFRTRGGVERRPKLGDFPTMTLAQARQVAKDMLLEVAKGNDPMAIRQAARAAPIVSELIDRYEKEYAPRRKSGPAAVKLLRKHLAKLDDTKVAEVTHSDIDGLHAAMKKSPVLANRVVAYASKMFSLAERWDYRPKNSNPCHGVERYKETKRRRYMSIDEAKAVASAMTAEAEKNPASVAFLMLLILTGARKGEIAVTQWAWVDGNVLRLPDSKGGNPKDIYLPPAAADVLDRLPRTTGTITGLADPKKVWHKIRVAANCPDLRMHDLRHSFASAALSAGLSLSQIGELLGHASTQTTKRYAHLVEDAAHAAAARTAETIQARLGGTS